MDLLGDVVTYVRRIIKSPSNASITDNLIVDYINRFWINDVDARIQLFDLKTTYQFQTVAGVDQYNTPLYSLQASAGGNPQSTISFYPVYQGFLGPAYVNGVEIAFYGSRSDFFRGFPNVVLNYPQIATGDGTAVYPLQIPLLSNPGIPLNPPINALLRGHVDITGVIATGSNADPILAATPNLAVPVTSTFAAIYYTATDTDGSNIIVTDSGQFLNTTRGNFGLLINPGPAPLGNQALPGGYDETHNTVDYLSGAANVTFPLNVPPGSAINAQCRFFQSGLPRAVLYYNNTLTLRNVPDRAYLVEIDAYLSPAAYLTTSNAIQFGYMSEYIARGAARKILSDTGDIEQMQFYEPLFREQEMLVWKRSQRQFTSTRVQTIYSQGPYQGQVSPTGSNSLG